MCVCVVRRKIRPTARGRGKRIGQSDRKTHKKKMKKSMKTRWMHAVDRDLKMVVLERKMADEGNNGEEPSMTIVATP